MGECLYYVPAPMAWPLLDPSLQFHFSICNGTTKKPGPQARLITPHEQLKAYCTCNRKNLCGALMAFVNM